MSDAKQINVFIVKRKNHTIIAHDDNAINAAEAG
jgi:hypothetical protein